MTALDELQNQLLKRGWQAIVTPVAGSWLVRGQSHPYSALKWVIREQPQDQGVFVGAELNKGLDRAARGYNAGPQLVMQRPWVWSAAGEDAIAAELSGFGPLVVNLWVTSGLVPGFTPDETPFHHQFGWRLEQGQLQLLAPVFDVSSIGSLSQYTTLGSVLQQLTRLAEYRWLWVRLQWGRVVPVGAVRETVQEFLDYFGDWYRLHNDTLMVTGG